MFLKMSSRKTSEIAESLYNKGFLSYPRTETDSFPPTIDLRQFVQMQVGDRDYGAYAQG